MSITDQVEISESVPPPQPPTAAPPGPSLWRRYLPHLAAIACGWAVAGLATITQVAWILPPLLILAVAAVLRTGRTLLDRLMLATLTTAGSLVTGALLFSVWPWGLAPFPVAGAMFTAVVAVAAATGRRPNLPRRGTLSDLIVLGAGGFTLLAAFRPVLRLTSAERLLLVASSEDRAAHFAIFDTIHRLGSYPFLDQEAARISVQTPTEVTYPPGSHLIYALLDIFNRSATDPGPALATFNRYALFTLAGYAFMIMATVWGARWILTPLVRGWRLIAATAAVAAIGVGGPLMDLYTAGFDSQILGLAFLVLTAAVAVHRPAHLGDRVVLLGAGLILVGFVYNFYLPAAGLAVLASFLVDRRVLRRHWRGLLAAGVVVAAIAAIPSVCFLLSSLSVQSQSVAGGAPVRIPDSALLAVTFASLAMLATPAGRRSRRVRVAAVLVCAMAVVVVLFGVYQVISLGKTSYYFNKLLMSHYLIALICSVPVVTLLAAAPAGRRGTRPARRGEAVLAVAAAAFALTALAGFGTFPRSSDTRTGQWGTSSLGQWYSRRQADKYSAPSNVQLLEMADRGLLADGTPTLFIVTDNAYVNWRVSFYNGALNRTNGKFMKPINGLLKTTFGVEPTDQAIDVFLGDLDTPPGDLRIVVRDRKIAQDLNRALADRPELRCKVVQLN